MTELESLTVFSTCPQSKDVERDEYLERIREVARWSEEAGYQGILVYTDNSIVDPWLVTQLVVEATERLSPLVAIQPVYMHPYSVAKMVASIGHLHGRRLYLNVVAGGFKNDLEALNDTTPHDERYDRAVEYVTIIKELLASPDPVSFSGRYYKVTNLRMTPPLDPELFPGLLMSGSSDAGLAAGRAIGATAVKYPKPPDEEEAAPETESGMRVGIISREDSDEAWRVARERFPEDRKGQITHKLAMKVSDSEWHRQLSEEREADAEDDPYWLVPFQNYKTFCPYLVGSYERVAGELASYMRLGFATFILDIPPSEEEIRHTGAVFREALGLSRR
ncbi:MAG: LLM class flavin-dependent oxidoreductase [Solirubrobacterales bacterium]